MAFNRPLVYVLFLTCVIGAYLLGSQQRPPPTRPAAAPTSRTSSETEPPPPKCWSFSQPCPAIIRVPPISRRSNRPNEPVLV